MIGTIIGGAIAALIGAVGYAIIGLWLEHRREKAKQLAIVNALIVETAENLMVCKSPRIREMWWLSPFRLEAYHAYKGQLSFLPKKVCTQLVAAAIVMGGENVVIQMHQSREVRIEALDRTPKPIPDYLIKQLEFVNKELRKWRAEHTR